MEDNFTNEGMDRDSFNSSNAESGNNAESREEAIVKATEAVTEKHEDIYGASSYSNYNFNENRNYSTNPYASEPVKQKKEKKKKEKKEHGFAFKFFTSMAVGLAFGVFAAGGFYGTRELLADKINITESKSSSLDDLQKQIDDLEKALSSGNTAQYAATNVASNSTDVTSVVDKVMPSMVSVTNLYEQRTSYFGRIYAQDAESSGSGIIIGENDSEYFIATNYHVISDTKNLTVQFVDDATVEAYVKGYDSNMDIAVIAVKKENVEDSTKRAVRIAEIGDSDSLKIGEPSIAIGNALGYGQSVTTGVISALNREIELENSVSDLIQTSAAINPGNSGGALLNIQGQVIGINSSKIGSTTVEGMGFAIPINEVKDIISEFSNRETKDKVAENKRGYLGIGGRNTSDYNLPAGYPEGVLIVNVYEGSAAENAGIYPNDIVTKANNQTISSIEALQEYLSYYGAGETVTITLQRIENGQFVEKNVEVTLGDRSSIKE